MAPKFQVPYFPSFLAGGAAQSEAKVPAVRNSWVILSQILTVEGTGGAGQKPWLCSCSQQVVPQIFAEGMPEGVEQEQKPSLWMSSDKKHECSAPSSVWE